MGIYFIIWIVIQYFSEEPRTYVSYKLNPITVKANSLYAPTSKVVVVFSISFRPVSCMGMDDLSWALEFQLVSFISRKSHKHLLPVSILNQ